MDKKYPIGTKIKYIGGCTKCKDEIGTVVGMSVRMCVIKLPLSTCGVFHYDGTMSCSWSNIVPILAKNQQLEFAFMQQS